MLHDLALAVLVPGCAMIHRVRGGLFPNWHPLKATYWIWIFVAMLAFLAGDAWPVALAWGLGYLIWTLPAWMSVITRALGVPVPAGQIMGSGWDVRLVNALSFGNPKFGCFVRATVFLIPLAAALTCLDVFDGAGPLFNVAPLLIIVAVFLPAYVIGYRFRPTDMSSIAEWLVGASWGAAILLTFAGSL